MKPCCFMLLHLASLVIYSHGTTRHEAAPHRSQLPSRQMAGRAGELLTSADYDLHHIVHDLRP